MDRYTKRYSVKQIAEAFAFTPETIRRWIKRGELSAKKIDGIWLATAEDIKGAMSEWNLGLSKSSIEEIFECFFGEKEEQP